MNERSRVFGAFVAGAAPVSQAKAEVLAPPETLFTWFMAAGFAVFADGRLPPDQALFAWSVAGTVVGSALGGLHVQGGIVQRIARMGVCFFSGLLLAPYAIARLPRAAEITPDWWHAFAASGIAAAVGWIIADEAGDLIRSRMRRRDDQDQGGDKP